MPNEILFTIFSIAGILTPVALVAGLVLLLLGVRGRVTDDHPVCKACGFDLHGIGGVGDGGSTPVACPECGRNVSDPSRLRRGNRSRRPRFIATGTTMVAFSLVSVAFMVFAMSRGVAWFHVMPSWALAIQTGASSAATRRAAITELGDRIARHETSDWLARQVAGLATTAQEDQNTPWLVEWGDLVETCWHRGLVEPTEYREFIRRGVTITCRVNPVRDVTSPTPDELIDITPVLDASIQRVGLSTAVQLRVRLIDVRFAGQVIEGNGNEAEMLTLGISRPVILVQQVEARRGPDPLPEARARIFVSIRGTDRSDGDGADRAEIRQELEFPYDVRSEGDSGYAPPQTNSAPSDGGAE